MIVIILSISVLANIALIIGVRNLLKQNEELEDTLIESMDEVKTKVSTALEEMRALDLKGSFESEDEVGVVFKELKDIVESLNEAL